MKRLPKIAKEQNIGVSTLIDYCERLGHTRVTRNSKIEPKLESQIIDLHKGKKNYSRNIS